MPVQTVSQWDPEKVIVTIANVPITEFEPGEYINASRTSDTFTSTVNLSGGTTVNRSHDRRTDVSLTLARNSPSNAALDALFLSAEAEDTIPVFDLQIKDLSGSGLLSSRAIIRRPPDWVAGETAQPYTWSFTLLSADHSSQGLTPI